MFRAGTSFKHLAATLQMGAGDQEARAVNELPNRLGGLAALAQWQRLRRGLVLLSYTLLVGLVGVLLLVATATVPVLFGYHTYTINGGSMGASLKLGSVAVTSPTSPHALKVGDIIAWRASPENPPVLHRIIKITEIDGQRRFITQGDENRTPDQEPLTLQGPGDRVVYSVPYTGYLLSFAQSGPGRLALIGVPLALLVAGSLREGGRSASKKEPAAEPVGRDLSGTPALALIEPEPEPAGPELSGTPALALIEPEPEPAGRELSATPQPAGPSPFRTQAGTSDLPEFLVQQLQNSGTFRPKPGPFSASSIAAPLSKSAPTERRVAAKEDLVRRIE